VNEPCGPIPAFRSAADYTLVSTSLAFQAN